LLTLCSIVVVSASKLTNFQYTVMRIMLAWLLFAGSTFLATDQVAPFQLYLMVPPISYFGVQFFMLIRRQALADLLFLVFLLLVVAFNYGSYHLGFNTTNGISYKTINTNIKRDIQGKHLLVIGDDAGLYVGNSMATPYINWQLTEGQLGVLNNYYNMSAIHRNFKNDMPDVIVDEKGIAPQLFYHLPLLEKEYRLERENVYVRKP